MTALIPPRHVHGGPKPATVRPWTWQDGHGNETRGAQLRTGRFYLFVPRDDLRAVADALHDLADLLEEWQ